MHTKDAQLRRNLIKSLGEGYINDPESELIIYTGAGVMTPKKDKMFLGFKISFFESEFICTPTMVIPDEDTYMEIQIEILPRVNRDVALWILVNRKGFLCQENLTGKAVMEINKITKSFIAAVKRLIQRQEIEEKIIGFLVDLNVIDFDQAVLPFHKEDGATIASTKSWIAELVVDFDDIRRF
jgi:hypothetical protein